MPYSLPISAQMLPKTFLSGQGAIQVHSDADAWRTLLLSDQPFTRRIDPIADLKLDPEAASLLRIGHPSGLQFEVCADGAARHRLELLWPGAGNPLLQDYNLSANLKRGKLYLRLVLDADGSVSAQGSYPVGPLSATFGIGAGARVSIERFQLVDDNRPARQLLRDLFASLRLPQQVEQETGIPAPGELLLTRFGGYLQLSAGLIWGYALAGSRDIRVEQLDLDFQYALKPVAAVTAGFRLAGDFEIQVRAGAEPGWARLTVKKSRDAVLPLAADFGFTGDFELEGWPETSTEFLARLLGADAAGALRLFDQGAPYADIGQLEKNAGPLIMSVLRQLCRRWLDAALDNATLPAFLTRMAELSALYRSIDSRILALYASNAGEPARLAAALRLLTAAGTSEDLRNLTGSDAWDILRRLYNGRIHDLLLRKEEFQEMQRFARAALDFVEGRRAEGVRALLEAFRESIPLDKWLQDLSRFNTPEKLRGLTASPLRDLAGRLLGKNFDTIPNSEFAPLSARLNRTLKKLVEFRETLYARLKQSARQSLAAALHYGFTHATHQEALLDVELDLRTPEGRRLMHRAAAGDFAGLLASPENKAVRLLGGVFTECLHDTLQFRVHLLGWTWQGLTELVQNAEHSIEAHSGALLHLYTTETWIRMRRENGRKCKELVQSKFLFRTIGAALENAGAPAGGHLAPALRSLGAEYELLVEDERTDASELSQCLDLAEYLGLIPDRQEMVEQLNREFPAGLGKVRATYIIRYDDRSIRNAFTLSAEELDRVARETMRRYIATRYTSMKRNHRMADLGFLYLSPRLHDIYEREGWTALRDTHERFLVPGWFTGGPAQWREIPAVLRPVAVTLFQVEARYRRRLRQLDELFDCILAQRRKLSWKDLEKASRDFVVMADDLDQFRENAFFVVFDQLIRHGGAGKGRQESALVLEITPPGGETVTKIWMPAAARR